MLRCRKSLSFLNFKEHFFFFFFISVRAVHVISQISQSHHRTLTLTLENWRGHFSRTFLVCFYWVKLVLFELSLAQICYPFVWNLNILEKYCGSFKKFNTYFLRSLVSSLFFCKLDFLQGCPVYTFQHLRHSFFWKPKTSRLMPSYLWFLECFCSYHSPSNSE